MLICFPPTCPQSRVTILIEPNMPLCLVLIEIKLFCFAIISDVLFRTKVIDPFCFLFFFFWSVSFRFMTHSDNDGYQSDSEVNGKNGGNGDSGVVVSPKPEMNGTEETKEDNKPKKKKMKKKKKAPDLNESLIERPPAEKKTKPTEVTT